MLMAAGIVPLKGLPETLAELTDAQLCDGRDLTRRLLEQAFASAADVESAIGHDGGFGALESLLGKQEQWQTRALVVVCVTALLRVDEGQNRTRLEGIIQTLRR